MHAKTTNAKNCTHEHSGYPGGQPFSDYLQMEGKPVSLQKYEDICVGADMGTWSWAQQIFEFNVIVLKEKHTFLGFMLATLAKISNYSKAR